MNNISGLAGAGPAAASAQGGKSSAGQTDLEQLSADFKARLGPSGQGEPVPPSKETLHKAIHKSILNTGLRMTQEAAAEARKNFDG
jgi:hypothetical protein